MSWEEPNIAPGHPIQGSDSEPIIDHICGDLRYGDKISANAGTRLLEPVFVS